MQTTLEALLQDRMSGIESSDQEKPRKEQRHLDTGTDERAYWHHGYASALKDVLRMIQGAGGVPN